MTYPENTLFPEYIVDREQLLSTMPKTVPIYGRKFHMLIEPWAFEEHRSVPYGFIYDGASIPKPARAIYYSPFDGRILAAATRHDWEYYVHHYSRKIVDLNFHEECKPTMNKLKAWMAYRAVRAGGGSGWINQPGDIAHMIVLAQLQQNIDHGLHRFNFPVEVVEYVNRPKVEELPKVSD